MELESLLAQERKDSNYDYESNHFTDSILKREVVPHPKAGDVAPGFDLPDENGNHVSLEELLSKGPCIISFVKGEYCQFCDLELKALQRALPDFRKHGATLVGVSPHTVSLSQQMKEKKGLTYSMLSDAGNEIAYKYGLRFKMQQPLLDVFSAFGLSDTTPIHGDQGENTNTLPIPGTFVIGPDKTILFSFVDSDHTKRAEPSEIVAALMTVAN